MSCKQWNDGWIAHLYGELEATEERVLSRHLDSCAECRETLAGLEASRQLLQGATPAVPASPPVVVLQPRRVFSRPVWAFAAGLAAAALLLAVGVGAGLRLGAQDSSPTTGTALNAQLPRSAQDATPVGLQELAERQDRFERQIADLTQAPQMSWPQVRQELQTFYRTLEAKRLEDFGFMLEQITAAEQRQGNRIDLTREALRYVALNQDPRLSQQ